MGYRGWTKNHAAVNPAEAKERPCHWPERHVPWSNWNEIEKKNGEHQTTTTLINSLRRPFDLSFRYIQPFRASTIEKLLYWPMKRDTKLAARNNTTEGGGGRMDGKKMWCKERTDMHLKRVRQRKAYWNDPRPLVHERVDTSENLSNRESGEQQTVMKLWRDVWKASLRYRSSFE